MSAWINYFAKRKGNNPPVARGGAKWCGARLLCQGVSVRWGGGVHRSSPVGERRYLMGSARLSSCSVFLFTREKLEMQIVSMYLRES